MSPRLRRTVLALAAVFLAAIPALAQLEPDGDGESDWEAFVPASTATLTPAGATTPEGGFSAPERVKFGEKMREHVLDQLCRSINLSFDYHAPGDFSGTGGRMRRWLAPMPDGRLTIVDEELISVGYGHTFSKTFTEAGNVALGVGFGVRVEGGSMVIRPLEGKATCKEIDRLIDLRDIKTVLPFKAARVAAMRTGELWRLPFSLTMSHTESASVPAVENVGVSLSFGGAQTGAATLTVFRLSESQLRFRFRIDRVKVRSRGGGVVATLPAVQAFAAGANIGSQLLNSADVAAKLEGHKYATMGAKALADALDSEIIGQINRYAIASLGVSNSRTQGKRVVLEYVVDPRDPVQAEAVAKALHGDFESLAKMAWRLGTQQTTDGSTEAAYLRMKEEHDAKLGAAAYAAIDSYRQRSRSGSLNLPFLMLQNWGKSKSDNTMTRYTGEGGEYHFERADKSRSSEYLTLPYLGPLVKDNVQRDVQVVTQAKAGEAYGDPIVVYLQQHGFLHESERQVRKKAQQFSDIMALAGTRGGGPDPRLALPLSKYFPEPPSPTLPNRKGAMAFTLVFSQAGVKQLANATAEDILKSYAAVCDSQPAMQWLLANAKLAGGKLLYDWNAAKLFFPDTADGRESDEASSLASLAKEAAGLIADLAAVRDAPDNESRSKALAEAFGGAGKSGLKYDDALRVFVQLVDPMNLTGDFVATVDRPRKQADVAIHLVLKKNRPENELLRAAGEAKSRFAEPSILTD